MTEVLQPIIPEASLELIEPTRKVVQIALKKVREGTISNSGKQTIILKNNTARKLYKVTDVNVIRISNKFESKGSLEGGLFINEFAVNEDGSVNRGLEIQIPRSVDCVNPQSIFLLRGLSPNYMNQLANELLSTTKVD